MNKPSPKLRIHAFIDAQNVKMAITAQGWEYDLARFRRYLSDKYGVTHAWFFIGYLADNERFYKLVKRAGFKPIFKEVQWKNG